VLHYMRLKIPPGQEFHALDRASTRGVDSPLSKERAVGVVTVCVSACQRCQSDRRMGTTFGDGGLCVTSDMDL
jgi:hypothetical protein